MLAWMLGMLAGSASRVLARLLLGPLFIGGLGSIFMGLLRA